LFRDLNFDLLFLAGAIATYSLLAIPFLAPLYASSIGLSPKGGAALVASYNLASGVGRIAYGFLCDVVGPVNSLSLTTLVTALSLLVLWPEATTIAPFAAFIVLNGASSGGFFSCVCRT
jgi:nitrate/nitrite transporter NarK